MSLEFEQVELGEKGKEAKRLEKIKHYKRTLIYMAIGALLSLAFSYLTEGATITALNGEEITNSLLLGGFMGFFITNSPCARGRC
ncbi:MAG: hypothetical protein CMP48_13760 [Rickettsiales bacterium]|nr:hypothetical protein [Rickettsiales bacterium]